MQRRFWGSATSWFTRADIGVRGLVTTDHAGRLTDQIGAIYADYTGPCQSEAFANIRLDKETYQGVTYNLTRHMFDFAIQPTGAFRLGVDGQVGDDIDVANARPASLVRRGAVRSSGRWGTPLNLQLSHTFERLSVEGGRLYTANLTQLRAIYHFNVHTFVRAILQYTDVARNPDLYHVARDLIHEAPVLAVPVLLQAQSPDRAAGGLLGQLRRGLARVADAGQPDVLREDWVRVGPLDRLQVAGYRLQGRG